MDERRSHREEHGADGIVDGILGASFGGVLLLNAVAIFALPDMLGYPMGGHFLLTACPTFALATAISGTGVAVFTVVRRRGFWLSALISLGLLAMAVGNGWLWILAVRSV